MKTQTYKYLLLTAVTLAVVSCGPKKQEEAKPAEKPMMELKKPEEKPMMELKKPEEKPMMELKKPEEGAKKTEPLTPEKMDKLKIDEDNIMNPFPG